MQGDLLQRNRCPERTLLPIEEVGCAPCTDKAATFIPIEDSIVEAFNLAFIVKQALMLILMLSLPVVVVVGLTGLAIAFLQAITQVQDQTIAFGIKIIAATVVIALMSGWLGGELLTFADSLYGYIAHIR